MNEELHLRFCSLAWMLAANVSFPERGEERKGGGGERGGFYRRLITHRRHTGLPQFGGEKTWNSIYVYAGTKHIVFNILHQKFQTCTSLFAISFKISHEILEWFWGEKGQTRNYIHPLWQTCLFWVWWVFPMPGRERNGEREREGDFFYTHPSSLFPPSFCQGEKKKRSWILSRSYNTYRMCFRFFYHIIFRLNYLQCLF